MKFLTALHLSLNNLMTKKGRTFLTAFAGSIGICSFVWAHSHYRPFLRPKGQKAREMGSPDFCHPQRNEELFDEHIDDFSILSILLSLCIVFVNKNYLTKYGAEDRLLFSKNDYSNIQKSIVFNDIPSVIETSTNYKTLFDSLHQKSFDLLYLLQNL